MSVVWCEPPHVGGPLAYAPLLAEVMERPGRWAMIRPFDTEHQAYDAARYLRKPRCPKPTGVWSFRAGHIRGESGRWGVWARWEPET